APAGPAARPPAQRPLVNRPPAARESGTPWPFPQQPHPVTDSSYPSKHHATVDRWTERGRTGEDPAKLPPRRRAVAQRSRHPADGLTDHRTPPEWADDLATRLHMSYVIGVVAPSTHCRKPPPTFGHLTDDPLCPAPVQPIHDTSVSHHLRTREFPG